MYYYCGGFKIYFMYPICYINTISQQLRGILFSDNNNNLYFQAKPNFLEKSQFDVPHVVLNDTEEKLKDVRQITGSGILFLINGENHVGFRNLLTDCKEIKKIISDKHGSPDVIATNAQLHGIQILAADYNIQQDNNSTMYNMAPVFNPQNQQNNMVNQPQYVANEHFRHNQDNRNTSYDGTKYNNPNEYNKYVKNVNKHLIRELVNSPERHIMALQNNGYINQGF